MLSLIGRRALAAGASLEDNGPPVPFTHNKKNQVLHKLVCLYSLRKIWIELNLQLILKFNRHLIPQLIMYSFQSSLSCHSAIHSTANLQLMLHFVLKLVLELNLQVIPRLNPHLQLILKLNRHLISQLKMHSFQSSFYR